MSVDEKVNALQNYFIAQQEKQPGLIQPNSRVIVIGYSKKDCEHPVMIPFVNWEYLVVKRNELVRQLEGRVIVYFSGDTEHRICDVNDIGKVVTIQALMKGLVSLPKEAEPRTQ